MKIVNLIQAALIAMSLAGGAQATAPAAAAPAAPKVIIIEVPSMPASEVAAAPDSTEEEVPPGPHAQIDAAAAPVPEPQVFLMMLIGLVLLGVTSSRREAYEKFTD